MTKQAQHGIFNVEYMEVRKLTRLLVLGMLNMQPMSGYDIQQMLKLTNANRWGGVLIGSIYHALKKLEQEKYIEIESVEQTGHRQKAVYKITDTGNEHLKELVAESLQSSSVQYPSTLYSGLSFLNIISPKQTKQALEQQLKVLEEEYHALEYGQKAKEEAMGDGLNPLMQLIFNNMFSIVKQQQDFLQQVLQLIEQEQ